MFQNLVPYCTAHRSQIIQKFQIGYAFWILFLLFAIWVNFSDSSLLVPLYKTGVWLGKTALCVFVVVTAPGILGRFGFKHPLITIGIMFRRHTGITMFLLALAHGLIVYELPQLAAHDTILPRLWFELFGMLTLLILTPLFLTSNLYSMQHLGKNWKRIHKLIYVAFWLMVFHIGLQGDLLWTSLIAATGILEVASLVYDWRKTAAQPSPVPPTAPPPAAI